MSHIETSPIVLSPRNRHAGAWTRMVKRSVREWHAVKSQFAIMFEERFPMA